MRHDHDAGQVPGLDRGQVPAEVAGFMWKGRWVSVFAGGADDDPPNDPPADPPQGGDGTGDGDGSGTPPGDDSGKSDLSVEEAKRALADARREAAKHRKEAKAALDALKAKEDAEKSELDRAKESEAREKDRADAAEARLKAQVTDRAIEKAAKSKGFIDPEDAVRLIGRDDLDVNDDGEPAAEKVNEALAVLGRDKPHLLGQPTNGSPTNPGGGKGTKLTKEDVKKMSVTEINKRWDEVQAALKS